MRPWDHLLLQVCNIFFCLIICVCDQNLVEKKCASILLKPYTTSFLSSVNELLKCSTFTAKKGSKSYGTISVEECKITGAETSQTVVQPATATAPTVAATVPSAVPVEQFNNMTMGELPLPVPPPQKPTFVDYITGNCDLSMVRTALFFISFSDLYVTDNTFHTFSLWQSILLEVTEIQENQTHCIISVTTAV